MRASKGITCSSKPAVEVEEYIFFASVFVSNILWISTQIMENLSNWLTNSTMSGCDVLKGVNSKQLVNQTVLWWIFKDMQNLTTQPIFETVSTTMIFISILQSTVQRKHCSNLWYFFFWVLRLCTLDGRPVCHHIYLKNNQHYVAVGAEKFKALPYEQSIPSRDIIR